MWFNINIVLFVWIVNTNCLEICPAFTDITRDSFQNQLSDAKNILDFKKYDTANMKYYIMTPRSYPNFKNPDGKFIEWPISECADKPLLFNCHGYRESGLHVWAIDLLRTYVLEYGGCAVSSDYEGASRNLNYPVVVIQNTGIIAEALADYIATNICVGSTNCTDQLQLHGHSWGAHTCGIAGYNLSKRNLKPYRMIASDAAGPYFNLLRRNDPSSHMSKKSGRAVINIKTSNFYGMSLEAWAHQTQKIGKCSSGQKQCADISMFNIPEKNMCDHKASVFITKNTMKKNFPLVKVPKCSSCYFGCTKESDYLGWRSEGKNGLYVIEHLPICLNVTIDSAPYS